MTFTFPNNPVLNDEVTVGTRIFIFDGIGWVPKAADGADVVQTTGTSTTAVMSQKAVTDTIDGHINDTENAHMASAIGLTGGKSLQQAIDDGDIGGGSGHTITDTSSSFPQRDNLQFTGNIVVSDNGVDTTTVNIKNSPWTTSYIDSATTQVFTAAPWVVYLIIATDSPVTVRLPNVVAGNTDEFKVTLYQNTHKVTITTVGGSQSIGGYSQQLLPTVGGSVHLKANNVNGYDVINDTRGMSRTEILTTDRDFSDGDGFENDVIYICQPSGNELQMILPEPTPISEAKSISARWLLDGEGIVTITAVNSTINEQDYQVLTKTGTSFTLTLANGKYFISDDNRDTIIPNLVQYLVSEDSIISDTLTGMYFKQRCTSTDDVRYSNISQLSTISATSVYPTMSLLQSSISDQNVLTGYVPGNSILTCIWGYVTGGPCYFRVEYYLRTNSGVETLIGKSHTSLFTNTSVEEICMYAQFNDFVISPTDRIVVRPYLAKKNSGDTVTISFYVEGVNGTRSGFTVPLSSMTHNSINGKDEYGAHPLSAIAADSGNNGKFIQVDAITDTFNYVDLNVDPSPDIITASDWDGTSYSIDLSTNKLYRRTVNNLVTSLTFALTFPLDASSKSRYVTVIIDNSGNSSAISNITFTGSWRWDVGILPTGLAAGAIATLELYNENATDVKPNWTVRA